MAKRELRRTNDSHTLYSLGCRLRLDTQVIEARLVNFHFLGACLKVEDIESLPKRLKGSEKVLSLDLMLGNTLIKPAVPYKVVWENLEENGEFGVKFISSSKNSHIRSHRMQSHGFLKPLFIAKDPVDPNRQVYFTVENVSKNGLLLTSALTNRHLFPGMALKEGYLSLPGETRIAVDCTIAHTRPAENWESFFLGCAIDAPSQEYLAAVRRYLMFLGKNGEDEEQDVRQHFGKEKKLKSGLSFKTVTCEREYEAVLDLRYKAHLHKKKISAQLPKRKLGDGAANEGIIIAGYLSGVMVCSVELRGSNLGHSSWVMRNAGIEHIDQIGSNPYIEVGRMVIHPQVQNSDVLIALYERVFAFCVVNGLPHLLLAATPKLVPLYQRLGIKETGHSFEHPILKGETLNVMVASPENYALGKDMSLLAKQYLFHSLDTYYSDRSLDMKYKIGFFGKIYSKVALWLFFTGVKLKKLMTAMLSSGEGVTEKKGQMKASPPSQNAVHSEQHYNATIVLPYIREADELIGRSHVDRILKKLDTTRAYLADQSNWLSVDFLDDFLTEYQKFGNVAELSWKSGERAMTKSMMGVTYHVVKHFPSCITMIKAFKRLAEKFNRTRNYKFEVLKQNKARLMIGLKKGHKLPKHREGCLNWESGLYSFICMVTNKKAKVEKTCCVYDGDSHCEYIITWNERTKGIMVLSYAASLTLIVSLGVFLNYHDYSPLENVLLTVSTAALACVVMLAGALRKKVVDNTNITRDFESFQEEAFVKYKLFQQQKKELLAQKKKLRLLTEVTRHLLSKPSLDSVVNTSLKYLSESFTFKRSIIMLKDQASHSLVTKAVFGEESYLSDIWRFSVDVSRKPQNKMVLSSVFFYGHTVYIEDVKQQYFQLNEKSKNLIDKIDCKAFVMVAVPSLGEENLGVIIADVDGDISPADIWILEKIAEITGHVIAKMDQDGTKLQSNSSIRSSYAEAGPADLITLPSVGQNAMKSVVRLTLRLGYGEKISSQELSYDTIMPSHTGEDKAVSPQVIDVFFKALDGVVARFEPDVSEVDGHTVTLEWHRDYQTPLNIEYYYNCAKDLLKVTRTFNSQGDCQHGVTMTACLQTQDITPYKAQFMGKPRGVYFEALDPILPTDSERLRRGSHHQLYLSEQVNQALAAHYDYELATLVMAGKEVGLYLETDDNLLRIMADERPEQRYKL